MSPETRSALSILARLRAEISHDRTFIVPHVRDVRDVLARWTAQPSRSELALAAVSLHAWYTGIETIFERIVRHLDGDLPQGATWHKDLVSQVAAEIPSIRPAVISMQQADELLRLLGFRHFFRHAYGLDLDPVKLHEHLDHLVKLDPEIQTALDHFDRFLEQTLSSLTNV